MPRSGPQPIVCTICGKRFGRKPDLNRHAHIHNPNAERFYCSYPACTHSSLQKSNLKTHYISRHLQTRHHKCRFDGCNKSYSDASALIRHEKTLHNFFRKDQKLLNQLSSMGNVALKLEAPSPSPAAFLDSTPSLCYPSSSGPSLASSESLSTSSELFPAPNPAPYMQDTFVQGQSTEAFLHEMIPEFFPDPSLEFMQDAMAIENPFNTALNCSFEQPLLLGSFYEPQAAQFPTFVPANVASNTFAVNPFAALFS